jgi:hypothetical protein
MPRSKTPNEDREVPHFPGLAKASAAAPSPNIDKPLGSGSVLDPQLVTVGTSTSPPAKNGPPPPGLEANPIGSVTFVKSGSKLRNQLSPSDLEHHGDTTPTTSVKPSIKIKMRNPYAPGFAPSPYRDHDKEDDEDYDDLDDPETPLVGRAKAANIPRNPYEDTSPDQQNPGNKPHDRWDAISVHTAKCDKCQGHNRKVVQRCKSCNLQFCQTCLEIVLQDGQHFAAATPFDWTPKPMIRSKRTNAATKKAKATAASKAPKYGLPLA